MKRPSGRMPEAVAVLDGLFASAKDAPVFHRDAGVALLQQNAGEPARRHLLAALPTFAGDACFRFNLAIAEISTGHPEEALTQFRAVVKLDPSDAAAHFQIGNILQMTRRGSESVPYYREALRLKPGWAFPANNLAWLLATHPDEKLRNGAEAVTLAKAVTAADGGRNPATLSTIAAAQAEAGAFADAIITIRTALDISRRSGAANTASLDAALKSCESGKPLRGG